WSAGRKKKRRIVGSLEQHDLLRYVEGECRGPFTPTPALRFAPHELALQGQLLVFVCALASCTAGTLALMARRSGSEEAIRLGLPRLISFSIGRRHGCRSIRSDDCEPQWFIRLLTICAKRPLDYKKRLAQLILERHTVIKVGNYCLRCSARHYR